MQASTQQAIALLKQGDRGGARTLLAEAVRADPADTQAWLWLSAAAQTAQQREQCLRRVLLLEPDNSAALRGLNTLHRRLAPPAQPGPVQAMARANEAVTIQLPSSPASAVTVALSPQRTPTAVSMPSLSSPARSRPSQVPVLLTFWLSFAGVLLVAWLLRDMPGLVLPVSGALAGLLLLVILYSALRNGATRYQFDGAQLIAPLRGRRASLPVSQIISAECQQTAAQRWIRTGDVRIHAAHHGELVRLRLRNVARCQQLAAQIQFAVDAYQSQLRRQP